MQRNAGELADLYNYKKTHLKSDVISVLAK